MGEVLVDVHLENATDRALVKHGVLRADEIRQIEIKAVVDTGAVMPVLPQHSVEALGLEERGRVIATYADECKEERPLEIGRAHV